MSKDIIIPNRAIKSQIELFVETKRPQSSPTISKKKKSKKIKKASPSLPPGFADIQKENDLFIIKMIPQITSSIMLDLLEFLYTGLLSNTANVPLLKPLSSNFQMPYLENYCDNIINNITELNPSIGTYLNDETGSRALEYFLNKALYSDLKFQVPDGTVFYGHKSIISARCEVMSAMLNSSFVESRLSTITINDVSSEAFSAFLQYIYTDHSPIEESPDSIGIIELANRFNLNRLTSLCELKITKQVEVATANDITKANIDIIGVLLASQLHSAKQLEGFCLHFISSNYQPMQKRSEWNKLEGENLKYIEENQWPPKSYLEELVA